MRDGKALQLATSHELGQNFARAFDITYTDAHGSAELGQVLADALAVAGSKPDIESLLNAVGGSVHDQVLAHTAIGGSGAHELFGGALIEDRTLMQMHETVMLHQLAAPSH